MGGMLKDKVVICGALTKCYQLQEFTPNFEVRNLG